MTISFIACPRCYGIGRFSCPGCGTDGQWANGKTKCCDSRGYLPCPDCFGTGRIQEISR